MTTREIVMDIEQPVIRRIEKAPATATAIMSNLKYVVGKIVMVVAGIILICFGLINTGSFYTNAGKMGGVLATVFYEYQAGTLLACIGSILIYDVVRNYFK